MKEFVFTNGIRLSVVNALFIEDEIIFNCISAILDITKNNESRLEDENDVKEVILGNYAIIFSWDDIVIINCVSHCGTSVINQDIIRKNNKFIAEFIDYIKNRRYENA